jgi:hypothetical protein
VRDPEIDPIKSKIGLGVSKIDLGESEIGFILFFIPHWPRRIQDWPYAYFNSTLAYHFLGESQIGRNPTLAANIYIYVPQCSLAIKHVLRIQI